MLNIAVCSALNVYLTMDQQPLLTLLSDSPWKICLDSIAVSLFVYDVTEFDEYICLIYWYVSDNKNQISILILRQGALSRFVFPQKKALRNGDNS